MKDNIATMNNTSVKEVMSLLLDRYEIKYLELENELRTVPIGKIQIINGKKRVYRRYYKGKVNRITSKKAEILRLCRKYRIQEQIIHIKKICDALKEIINEQAYEYIEDAKKMMPKNFKLLDDEYYEPNYLKAKQWQMENSTDNNFREDELKYKTKSGVKVRSKSEMIIANLLEVNNIRYVYESELKLGDLSYHPDFTIMRKYDNKKIFWEHCGMDTEEYLKRHEEKLKKYKAYGISEDSNLIVTYEKDLAENNIEDIIDKFLK